MEGFAGDPCRIFRGQEYRGGRDILRLADAAERSLGLDLLAEVAFLEPAVLKPSVSTGPGLMALTRIRRGPSSLDRERVTASTAALVALYTEALGGAAVLATELILTMLPPSAPKCFTASFAARISPRTLTSNCR